ncbi:MAG: HAMP domain-containing protein [Crocinitomix sp.]|nr:HAMP domain-containing protein [Crocinitomix sp.]
MSLSFKKRIATHFMLATALIIAFVFGVVYFIVQQSVYQNIDNDLSFEANKHTHEIELNDGGIRFINKGEWEESEHREVQVNPVFIQLIDKQGKLMDKSPNLKENELPYNGENKFGDHFNTQLNQRTIRQVQIPIERNGKIKGYIVAAMSLDSSLMVLENLRFTLFILFPIVMIGLFFISAFLAGRSIIPVVAITNTADRITKNNLNERIVLPQNKDELHDLSSAINSLLDRLGSALEREKQFTSDASHELRTPLSVLRGTLEVLIRKERSKEEYEEKVKYGLTEIDRMADIIDQLLALARFDSNPELNSQSAIPIQALLDQILVLRMPLISKKNITIDFDSTNCSNTVQVNSFYASLILDNVIGNAIKYSHPNGIILITLTEKEDQVRCTIKDAGIGIKKEDIDQVFTPFFRSDALSHKEIKGAGLGLSIAQKAALAINATLDVSSEFEQGTELNVNFKEILRNP